MIPGKRAVLRGWFMRRYAHDSSALIRRSTVNGSPRAQVFSKLHFDQAPYEPPPPNDPIAFFFTM